MVTYYCFALFFVFFFSSSSFFLLNSDRRESVRACVVEGCGLSRFNRYGYCSKHTKLIASSRSNSEASQAPWVPNEASMNCMNCDIPFSIIRRRHRDDLQFPLSLPSPLLPLFFCGSFQSKTTEMLHMNMSFLSFSPFCN